MRAHIGNNWGHIVLSMRGGEVDNLLPDLHEKLEEAADDGHSGLEVEVEITEGQVKIVRVIGPGDP